MMMLIYRVVKFLSGRFPMSLSPAHSPWLSVFWQHAVPELHSIHIALYQGLLSLKHAVLWG